MKKLLLLIVAIATVSLVSCKKDVASSSASAEASADTTKTEAAAPAAAVAPTPTGDPEADAKAYVDYVQQAVKEAKTEEDLGQIDSKLNELDKALEAAYKDNPDGAAKFKAAVEKAGVDYEKMMEEKISEIMGIDPNAIPEEPAEESSAK